MTPLKSKITSLIRTNGPMTVADYMAACLFDPAHGYYMTRQPFGRKGDFTTAPEISQMFGELIGVWLVSAWHALRKPRDVLIAEIGPGRGTLMADVARTIGQLEPDLAAAAPFRLIEVSPALMELQARTLKDFSGSMRWHTSIDDLPCGKPLLIVGNELFDAIPARQYIKTAAGWRERCISLSGEDGLEFVAGPGSLDPRLLPPKAANAPDRAIFEVAPAREALMQTIAARIAGDGGAGLLLDYGHLHAGFGDTLQAVAQHGYVDPLTHPGEADLTTHVDFAALAEAVRSAGLAPQLTTQGEFLQTMGLLERAGTLGATGSESEKTQLQSDVDRLAGPDGMGELFKVIALSTNAGQLPGFQ